jgi:D-amino-acid dehydrogenase
MSSAPDVVVVGGGAIGAAATYELARRGVRVSLLERSHVALGCSYGNAGLISPSHTEALANPAAIRNALAWMRRADSPFHLRPRLSLLPWLARFAAASLPRRSAAATATLRTLAAASLELHEKLARNGVQSAFARRGILGVFESEHALAQAARTPDARVLTAEAARDVEPALAAGIAGALYYPREAHCDPAAFVAALTSGARSLGADIRTGTEILRLRRSNGRIAELETTAGPMRAGAVVLAAGVWTRELAADIGVHVPLEGAKGYHIEVERRPSGPSVPLFLEDARMTATPIGDRLRLTGTLDLSGRDLRVDPVRLEALTRAARRTLGVPADARPVQVWRGLRPCAPDGLPIIGAADGIANMFLATGHAMLGIALAPVTGEIVADLVTGERPRYDVSALTPARFKRRTRRERS